MAEAAFDPALEHCPLCGSDRIRGFDRDFRGIEIARCQACGVKFMSPQYTDSHLEAFYAGYIGDEYHSSGKDKQKRRARKLGSLELIERFVRPGSFLSIGSGDGVELQIARSRGWSVTGYDVHGPTTERLGREIGCPMRTGALESLLDLRGAFQCVYLDQVLEHPKDPAQMLRIVRELLADDGVAYFGVPNIDSMSNRAKTFLGRLGLKRRRGKHYDSFHHLFYYSHVTLPRLLRDRYGYEPLAVSGDPVAVEGVERALISLRRAFPVLDSTFCVVARKRRG